MFSQEVMNVFWQTIDISIKGMSGIFLFMLLFFLIVIGLDKLFPRKIESKKD
jgi:Na+-transporting methylmalonyl-CoA/oxaloacetate decarboxylase gamma subunit